MGACVLLLHELSDGASHYDWLVAPDDDPEGLLIAFRVQERIDLSVVARFEAERMADHRRRYLTWEGELSGGRGRVTRLASGNLRVVATPEGLEFAGRLGQVEARFRGVTEGGRGEGSGAGRWFFQMKAGIGVSPEAGF